MCDINTTLDAKFDRYGYTSDTHRKCCSTIQNWFETGELIDVVRYFHPDSHLYSWRTKNFKIKGRIDHLLITPSLMPFISEARYIFHEHDISDHASLLFTIDIKKADDGPGFFRANPVLLNHPN